MTNEIKNAKITNTFLGREDHGILTFRLYLDYGNIGQATGGYALDKYNPETKQREGCEFGLKLIAEILRTLEVDSWESLKGQLIRVKSNHCEVVAIGHYLNDKWLNFKEFFEASTNAK